MVDEAHATGALGPGGRGSVAAAGLSDEVDVVVGTLGKALGCYGAYVCAGREIVDYLVNMARPFIFSTAPPPPVVAAAIAALELLASHPHRVERLQANAAALREALAEEGLPLGPSADPDRAADRRRRRRGRWSSASGLLERGVFAQAIRPPTVPDGLVAPAADGDGHPPRRRAAAGREAARRGRPRARRRGTRLRRRSASWASERLAGRAARGRLEPVVARGLRHRHRHRGRQDGRRGGDRPGAGRRRAPVAVFKPAVTGLDEAGRGRPRAAAPRRRLGPVRRRDRPLPLRAAGLPAPRRRSWPVRRSSPAGCGERARGGRRGRRRARLRGRRRADGPAHRRLPGPRLRSRPRAAAGDRRRAGAGDDQPHAADARGRPCGRPARSAASCSRPGRSAPGAVEESNRTTIASARRRSPWRRSRRSTS